MNMQRSQEFYWSVNRQGDFYKIDFGNFQRFLVTVQFSESYDDFWRLAVLGHLSVRWCDDSGKQFNLENHLPIKLPMFYFGFGRSQGLDKKF